METAEASGIGGRFEGSVVRGRGSGGLPSSSLKMLPWQRILPQLFAKSSAGNVGSYYCASLQILAYSNP